MKTRNYLIIIFSGLSALIITTSCDDLINGFTKGYKRGQLHAAAEDVNKSCPKKMDAETRLDSATIPTGENAIRYHYTLVNYTAEQLDTNQFKNKLMPRMVISIRTLKELKSVRENNITMQYSYYGKDKGYICMINIPPDRYKAK